VVVKNGNGTLKWVMAAITITTLIVTVTLTFASKADRVQVDATADKLNDTCERLKAAETTIDYQKVQLDRIERKLDRLIEGR
jgi:hypothetical protein